MSYFGKSSKSISCYRNSFSYIYLLCKKIFSLWIPSRLNAMIQLLLNHEQFYHVKALWVVKLPAEGCMACILLGCNSVAPFGKKKNSWKSLCVDRHAFFSPLSYLIWKHWMPHLINLGVTKQIIKFRTRYNSYINNWQQKDGYLIGRNKITEWNSLPQQNHIEPLVSFLVHLPKHYFSVVFFCLNWLVFLVAKSFSVSLIYFMVLKKEVLNLGLSSKFNFPAVL